MKIICEHIRAFPLVLIIASLIPACFESVAQTGGQKKKSGATTNIVWTSESEINGKFPFKVMGVTLDPTKWTKAADLEAGDIVKIQASGEWRGSAFNRVTDADGYKTHIFVLQLGSANCMALIGKLNARGKPFLLGKERVFKAEHGGSLALGPNDSYSGDNLGTMKVALEVYRAGPHEKVYLGPAQDANHLPRSLRESGGLLCQLPVNSEGKVQLDLRDPSAIREVVVLMQTVQFHTDKAVMPITTLFMTTPIRTPSRTWGASPYAFTRNNRYLLPDVQLFREARGKSPHYSQSQVTLEERPAWIVVYPVLDSDSGLKASVLWAEIYREPPSNVVLPVEVAMIGRIDSEGRRLFKEVYLENTETLSALRGVETDGKVAVRAYPVAEPDLEILVQRNFTADTGRKVSGALIEAKNKTLPKLLRESKTDKLVDLATMIEKRILEITHNRELAKDRAQTEMQKEQKNQPQIEADRKLALLCNEVIEVLKPILAAVKEEVSNRSK